MIRHLQDETFADLEKDFGHVCLDPSNANSGTKWIRLPISFDDNNKQWLKEPAFIVEKPEDEDWEDPILFDEIETPEISASLLPLELGNFAAALARTSETSESLSVLTILGVVSSIISRLYVVSPKNGWRENTNLYVIVGSPSATNKSLVLKNCVEPLSLWEKEQRKHLEPQIKKQFSEHKTNEKIIDNLRSLAAKEKDKSKQEKLIDEIAERELALIEPEALPCLFATDTTPEELAVSLYEQKNHFAIFSDEGGITEVLSGLYTGGTANIDVLLKGIDGGDVKIRRRNKSFDLNPILTIVLAVQPMIIQKMGAKKAYCGNGFLERFLYLFPKNKLGYRKHDMQPIPKEIAEKYNEIITNLLISVFERQKKVQEKIILTLAQEALSNWRNFQQEIEKQLRPNGAFYILQGWAGKISGFVLRIAAVIHMTKASNNSTVISAEEMASALEIGALLTQHAIAAYTFMGADEALQDAQEIFSWIKHQGAISFTQSEITFAMRHRKLGKKERLGKALEILINRNIFKVNIDDSTRKPTTVFLVNPKMKH